MPDKIRVRLLDLGTVDYLRSQTIWHGVAYAMKEDSPSAISLVRPDRPYICIGYHQELEKEVDLDFCQRQGLPLTRREVGGGTVYLDGNQVFTHFIFHRNRVPRQVEEVYKLFAQPLVSTYHAQGIPAYYRPVNDIQVEGRKIGGMGAALIGEAMVVATSLMFDFNHQLMAGALKVASEKMRDKVYESLTDYITTMRRELGCYPDQEAVKALFARECEDTLGIELVPDELSVEEMQVIEGLDPRFASWEWLNQKEGLPREAIKIKEGMYIRESAYKAPGGLIRATVRLHDDRIDDLTLSGDFTMIPGGALPRLERSLRGQLFQRDMLIAAVRDFYSNTSVQSPGVAVEDFVEAITTVQPAA